MEIFVTNSKLDKFMAAHAELCKRAAKCSQPNPVINEIKRWWECRLSMRTAFCQAEVDGILNMPWIKVEDPTTINCSPGLDYRQIIHFDIVTETIKLDGGWRLVGTVEPSGVDNHNFINSAPGSCQEDFANFRNGALRCDHCNAIRNRNMTIVVKNDNNEVKSVGTDCIKDFLGTSVGGVLQKATYAMALETFKNGDEDEGWGGGGGGGQNIWGIRRVAGVAIAVLRANGWAFLGRGKARERMDGTPATADLVMCELCPPPRHEPITVTDEDMAFANVAIEDCNPWIEEIQNGRGDTLTDYQHNVAIAIMAGAIDMKRIGLVTAAICLNYLRRAKVKNQPDPKESKHFGMVDDRLTLKLHPCKTYSMDSDYGTKVLINGWVEGMSDRWEWWTNPSASETSGMVKDGAVVDGVFELVATIKGHKDDKYGVRTCLTRVAAPKKRK